MIIIIIARLILALLFAVAGMTKLLDLQGTRRAVANFDVPLAFVGTLAVVLPIIELVIAIFLLAAKTAWGAAIAAVSLLGLFTLAISINLMRGRTPECHCFGELHSRPIGPSTILRNLVFIGIGMWLIVEGPARTQPSISQLAASGPSAIIIVVLVVLGMAAVFYFSRGKPATVDPSPEEVKQGLPKGTPAPAFEANAYDGNSISLASLLSRNKRVMLLFASPKCGPCAAMFAEVGQWQKNHRADLTIGIISEGTIKDNFLNVARHDLTAVAIQKQREIAEQYRVKLTPSAVMINRSGEIESDVAAGADDIRSLLNSVVATSSLHINHSR